jgi:hypothetical protein
MSGGGGDHMLTLVFIFPCADASLPARSYGFLYMYKPCSSKKMCTFFTSVFS